MPHGYILNFKDSTATPLGILLTSMAPLFIQSHMVTLTYMNWQQDETVGSRISNDWQCARGQNMFGHCHHVATEHRGCEDDNVWQSFSWSDILVNGLARPLVCTFIVPGGQNQNDCWRSLTFKSVVTSRSKFLLLFQFMNSSEANYWIPSASTRFPKFATAQKIKPFISFR